MAMARALKKKNPKASEGKKKNTGKLRVLTGRDSSWESCEKRRILGEDSAMSQGDESCTRNQTLETTRRCQ